MAVEGEHFEAVTHKVLLLVEAACLQGVGLTGLILMAHRGLRRETRQDMVVSIEIDITRLRDTGEAFGCQFIRGGDHPGGFRVVEDVRVVTQQTTAAQGGCDILHADSQLRRIEVVEFGVGIQMEALHLRALVTLLTVPETALRSTTDDLHGTGVGSHEGDLRIGDQHGLVADLHSRLAVWQVVDLQQHQLVIDEGPLLAVHVLQLRGEADPGPLRQFLDGLTALGLARTDHIDDFLNRITGVALRPTPLVDQRNFQLFHCLQVF